MNHPLFLHWYGVDGVAELFLTGVGGIWGVPSSRPGGCSSAVLSGYIQ
jgi:hypothetical protein